jgi:hypothetical protein
VIETWVFLSVQWLNRQGKAPHRHGMTQKKAKRPRGKKPLAIDPDFGENEFARDIFPGSPDYQKPATGGFLFFRPL